MRHATEGATQSDVARVSRRRTRNRRAWRAPVHVCQLRQRWTSALRLRRFCRNSRSGRRCHCPATWHRPRLRLRLRRLRARSGGRSRRPHGVDRRIPTFLDGHTARVNERVTRAGGSRVARRRDAHGLSATTRWRSRWSRSCSSRGHEAPHNPSRTRHRARRLRRRVHHLRAGRRGAAGRPPGQARRPGADPRRHTAAGHRSVGRRLRRPLAHVGRRAGDPPEGRQRVRRRRRLGARRRRHRTGSATASAASR